MFFIYKMVDTKKINDRVIKKYNGTDDRPWKYQDLFPGSPYMNIYIIGRKMTGKSLIAGNIILNCVCSKTVVRIFSPTMRSDHTTMTTINKLKKRNIDVEEYEVINPSELDA